MENREFFIDKDGFKLHAKLDFPADAAERMPLLLLIHGLTGHMEENHLLGIRDAALEEGYACLRVEMYGHGLSDGQFKNHNVMEWVCELIYVIDYARNLDFVTDIIMAGHSQGGLATILTAGMKREQLKAIIPLSPATVIKDSCSNGDFFGTKFDADTIPEELYFWEDKCVTANYIRVGRTLPIDEAIAAYEGPVMVVHGTEDESVPVSYGIKVAEGYKDVTLQLIDGDSHCYDHHLDKVQSVIKEFLRKYR